ncbi:ATP-binding protein [Lysinibacillus xylanilyticus]|uniref:ATP-binding protein n=1 Tax=Lysinibacillus xylanilyticus TaxID=582475 RepID=UPI003D054815
MKRKIMSLTFFILMLSFSIGGTFLLGFVMNEQKDKLENQALLVAKTVSQLPELKTYISNNNDFNEATQHINPVVEEIRDINGAQYIVVLDMQRRKYSHPNTKEIGQVSQSADLNAAFAEHYYTSAAHGEHGDMVRAFVPVMSNEGKQIGVVVVGYSVLTVTELLQSIQTELIITILISLLFSAWGAHTLGLHMKKQMFGLEPHEIAKMYVERTETFNAMHEGIIAIDNKLTITIFNEKACEILAVHKQPSTLIGKKIFDVLPDTRLPEILELDQPIFNRELYINGHSIMSNRIPIQVNGKTVGAVAMFKDRTEVKKLAEELTGVKAFVQALRVQTHEHKNKLHTIAGLLQLGHHEQALSYLTQVKEEHDEITNFLNERIKNENISGLLLSKISYAKEQGIRLEIDRESRLTIFPKNLDHHDFVILFGNLIENAFDALRDVQMDEKIIHVSVDEDEDVLAILVTDNGIGMSDEVKAHIFDNGYSTKEKKGRGIGLYLINEIVQKGQGEVEVISEPNKGTSFLITFYHT